MFFCHLFFIWTVRVGELNLFWRQMAKIWWGQIKLVDCDSKQNTTDITCDYWRYLQGTVLVNNSDQPLRWLLDLTAPVKALQEGIIKFLHPSGVPFVVMSGQESKGVEGILEAGQTQHISIIFCPSKSLAQFFYVRWFKIITQRDE